MRAAVTLHIDSPPDKIWRLVSDITKMGEYSPEVIEAEWIDGATGPAVGARYRGHVKRNENWPWLSIVRDPAAPERQAEIDALREAYFFRPETTD